MISLEKLGRNIYHARKKLKLSQQKVADDLKCAQSSVSRIEKGTYVGGECFFDYLDYLRVKKVDLNKLFGDSVE